MPSFCKENNNILNPALFICHSLFSDQSSLEVVKSLKTQHSFAHTKKAQDQKHKTFSQPKVSILQNI